MPSNNVDQWPGLKGQTTRLVPSFKAPVVVNSILNCDVGDVAQRRCLVRGLLIKIIVTYGVQQRRIAVIVNRGNRRDG